MAHEQNRTASPYSALETAEPSENLEALVRHQDLFIERDEEIRKAVESALENYGIQNAASRIYHNVQIAISASDLTNEYDEDDWDSLADAILGYIHGLILMESGVIDSVAEHDPSPALQHFLINSLLDYGPELQRMNFHKMQGRYWWSNIRTDRVLGEGSIRHKHILTIDRTEEVEIDSSPHSDWVLIEHLLSEIIEALDIVYEDPSTVIDVEYFNEVRRQIYVVEELIRRSESEIGAADREDIVEAVDDALKDHGVTE